jgi:hypothetical protein
MSDTRLRLLLIALFVVAFAALGASSTATTASSPASPQQATEVPREGPIPCDPSYTRTIEPRIVQEGGALTIQSQYRFICTGETRKVNVVFVVENSGYLRQGLGGREALDNITKGARNFVNQIDYSNGSRTGLMLYAATDTFRVPLTGGEDGRKALLEAFEGISIEPMGDSSGAGAAIRDATGALPTGVQSDFSNILIIVDAGAPEVPGSDLVDRYTACNAARLGGVTIAVLSFPQAGRRLAACASSGWFFQLRSNTAPDAPDTFDRIAEGMLRGLQMDKVTYSDFLEDGFNYTPGSGYPRDPDFVVLSEMFWEFVGKTSPPTGQVVEYQVTLDKDVFPGGTIRPISLWSYLEFTYAQGTTVKAEMPNPPVCIYKDSPSECAAFAITLTPAAEDTATPTQPPTSPTPSPTDAVTETPGVTETPEVTDTPSSLPPPTESVTPTEQGPTGFAVYLPAAFNEPAP